MEIKATETKREAQLMRQKLNVNSMLHKLLPKNMLGCHVECDKLVKEYPVPSFKGKEQ